MVKVITLVVAVSLGILISLNNGAHPPYNRPDAPSESISLRPVSTPQFIDETLKWGLVAGHHQSSQKLTGLNETMGGGTCVIDYDNDGWDDVFIVGGSGQHRFYGKSSWWAPKDGSTLWKNSGHETFVDVTEASGIPKHGWSMGCAVADLDNDGDDDLFLLNIGANILLRNNGDGSFTDISQQARFEDRKSWSQSATIADFDRDGLLDIYVINFVDYQKTAKVFEQSSGFIDMASSSLDPTLFNAQSNNLYKNIGNLKFTDVADELGVTDSTGRGMSGRWTDINNDFWPDLVVLNNQGSPNQLYINRQGKFTRESAIYRVESTVGSHGLGIDDIDNDGDVDMVLSRKAGSPPMLLINGQYAAQTTAYLSDDDKGLRDLAWEMKLASDITLHQTGWGVSIKDFNNDGYKDVFMANGLSSIDPDSRHVTTGQKNTLWLNTGVDFEKAIHLDAYNLPSRSVISADFNHDGLIDILETQNNGRVRLLINRSQHDSSWLAVKVVDEKTTASGARVSVMANGNRQYQQNYGDNSYLSQGTPWMHFAFAENASPVTLIVEWPDGERTRFDNIETEKYLVLNRTAYRAITDMPVEDGPSITHDPLLRQIERENRGLYIEVLAWLKADNWLSKELDEAFDDADPVFRKAVLDAALTSSSDRLLSYLFAALDDISPMVRKHAVNLLAGQELEPSVSWLMHTLSDENAQVRCAAANAFRFFYEEEEAVIYRKYLAVPVLIQQLLADTDDSVKICIMGALGESERYRAIQPLLSQLSHPRQTVRIAAIKAVGKLRDETAMSTLQDIASSVSEPISIRSHAFIALRRMQKDGLAQLVEEASRTRSDEAYLSSLISILDSIMLYEDGVVYPYRELTGYRNTLISNLCRINAKSCREAEQVPLSRPLSESKEAQKTVVSRLTRDQLLTRIRSRDSNEDDRNMAIEALVSDHFRNYKSLLLEKIAQRPDACSDAVYTAVAEHADDTDVSTVLWTIAKSSEYRQETRLRSLRALAANQSAAVLSFLKERKSWK